MNNSKIPARSAAVLASAGRRERERSEGERRTADANAVADAQPVPATSHPDPEVVAHAKRRRFNAEYKQRILKEVDAAKGSGGIGALLRREGLYSSLLATWRNERDAGALAALTSQKRGPKSKHHPLQDETDKLRRDNARLTEQLRRAEIVIDVQKKLGTLLGWPLPTQDEIDKL
jgi:transposase